MATKTYSDDVKAISREKGVDLGVAQAMYNSGTRASTSSGSSSGGNTSSNPTTSTSSGSSSKKTSGGVWFTGGGSSSSGSSSGGSSSRDYGTTGVYLGSKTYSDDVKAISREKGVDLGVAQAMYDSGTRASTGVYLGSKTYSDDVKAISREKGVDLGVAQDMYNSGIRASTGVYLDSEGNRFKTQAEADASTKINNIKSLQTKIGTTSDGIVGQDTLSKGYKAYKNGVITLDEYRSLGGSADDKTGNKYIRQLQEGLTNTINNNVKNGNYIGASEAVAEHNKNADILDALGMSDGYTRLNDIYSFNTFDDVLGLDWSNANIGGQNYNRTNGIIYNDDNKMLGTGYNTGTGEFTWNDGSLAREAMLRDMASGWGGEFSDEGLLNYLNSIDINNTGLIQAYMSGNVNSYLDSVRQAYNAELERQAAIAAQQKLLEEQAKKQQEEQLLAQQESQRWLDELLKKETQKNENKNAYDGYIKKMLGRLNTHLF